MQWAGGGELRGMSEFPSWFSILVFWKEWKEKAVTITIPHRKGYVPFAQLELAVWQNRRVVAENPFYRLKQRPTT